MSLVKARDLIGGVIVDGGISGRRVTVSSKTNNVQHYGRTVTRVRGLNEHGEPVEMMTHPDYEFEIPGLKGETVAKSSDREYKRPRKLTVSLPEGGKVTGTVELTVIRSGHIYITSDLGYGKPDNYVTYRGKEFRVSVIRAYLHDNGEWHHHPAGESASPMIYKRNEGFSLIDAPPSFAAAIVGAILDMIPNVVGPETLKLADYIDAYNDETSAMGKVEEAEAKLAEARAELEAVTARRVAAEA